MIDAASTSGPGLGRGLARLGVTVLVAAGLTVAPYSPSASATAAGTVIHVTTTQQKVGGPGGCSLQEAILAANQNSSIVFDPDGSGAQYGTTCEAGSGADVIELAPGTYPMSHAVDDVANYTGPTATPIITTSITIEGHGARLEHTGTASFRALAVGEHGNLDLREVDVVGYLAHGGGGAAGGGGGLGAGGAVYVHAGTLTVQRSTFESNGAAGGDGGGRTALSGEGGGGGGGLGGYGAFPSGSGGGGGGSRGNGGSGGSFGGGGGGGGGTLGNGEGGSFGSSAAGGVACGGSGGSADIFTDWGADGEAGECRGGGGGGGHDDSRSRETVARGPTAAAVAAGPSPAVTGQTVGWEEAEASEASTTTFSAGTAAAPAVTAGSVAAPGRAKAGWSSAARGRPEPSAVTRPVASVAGAPGWAARSTGTAPRSRS
jgi:hypothetical protein